MNLSGCRLRIRSLVVGLTVTMLHLAVALPFIAATFAAAPLQLDDELQVIQPRARTEAEQDRLEAVSLLTAGRMFEQRQDSEAALRRYQRAHRYDPQSVEILRAIVPLAFSLGRQEEAVRYATRLAELDATDPMLLRRLGVVLTERNEFKTALKLYEKVQELETREAKSATRVMLWLEMGRLYFITEQFDKAAAVFERASGALDKPDEYGLKPALLKTIVGDKGEVHELMANAFLEAKKPELAARAFERLDKFAANKALAAYRQARIAAQKQQYDQALAQLQVYFDARETSAGAGPYELLAEVLAEQKKTDELIPRLENLLNGQEGNISLSFALAEEYFGKQQFDKAEPLYKVVLAKQPADQVYRRLADIYRQRADDQKLLELLGDVVNKSGTLEAVEKSLATIVEDKPLVERLVKLARDKFADAKSENHPVLRAAALVALEAKQFDAAAELFELAIQANSANKAEVLVQWGLQLFLAEKFAESAAVFQRGIDEKAVPESNPAFHFYLAGALAMQNKTDAALAAAKAAVEKKSGDPRFESRIAWIHYHAKQYDQAIEKYTQLIDKYESNHDAEEVRDVLHDTRLVLSNICVERNQLADAEEWLEQVLDEFPDDIGATNDLGYLWADQNKRLERAHRMIRRAVEAEPENAAYRDSLGWVLYRLAKFDEALVEQLKAIELNTKKDKEADGVMYDHLGDIYAQLDRHDKAREAWSTAAAAFEKAGEKDKLEAVQKKLK